MRIKYNSEIISGLFFTIVAVIGWVLLPSQIQTHEVTTITARSFPQIAIGGLFLVSVILLLQGIFFKRKNEIVVYKDMFRSSTFRQERKSIVFAGLLVVYAIALSILGFLIATFGLVAAILIFYGSRKWYYYAIPLAMVVVVYYIFANVMRVSLPSL